MGLISHIFFTLYYEIGIESINKHRKLKPVEQQLKQMIFDVMYIENYDVNRKKDTFVKVNVHRGMTVQEVMDILAERFSQITGKILCPYFEMADRTIRIYSPDEYNNGEYGNKIVIGSRAIRMLARRCKDMYDVCTTPIELV